MHAILELLSAIIGFYIWIVIGSVVMSWLMSFNIVSYANPTVKAIYDFLHQMTEPVYAFVHRFLPPIGGLDLSPIVVILGLSFLQTFISKDVATLLLN